MEHAHSVVINNEQLAHLPIYDQPVPCWSAPFHYQAEAHKTLHYLFVLDTLNFCFWHPDKKWTTSFNGVSYSGYKGLSAALVRAIREDVLITNPSYLAAIQRRDLEHVLRGEGELLLMDGRVAAVNELGQILLDKYRGNALHVLEEASWDALSFASTMVRDFSSFRDIAAYKGHSIPIMKRAQILAADIYGAFGGLGWGALQKIDQLTIFADYKLPQLMHAYGVLQYAPALEKKIMNKEEITAGSEEETELRAATIQAAERIKQEFAARGRTLHAYAVDWILWNTAKELPLHVPHHCTKTIFY